MKAFSALFFLAIISVASAQTRAGDFHLDKNYEVNGRGEISLSASDAKVFITGSSRKDAHVKIDREVETRGMRFGSSEFAVDIEEDDGNLIIRERSGSGSFAIVGTYNEKYVIRIEVPEGVSLRINGDDGDYFINTIHGAIDVQLDDGDLELTGCKGNDFRFRLDDGSIKMDQGRGSLKVDADDANVEILNAHFDRISAEMDDGDIVIETSLTDAGDYYINSEDGFVSLTITGGGGKFDIRHDDTHINADKAFSTVEKSENRTRLTLPNGNAKVDIRADDAKVRLSNKG